MPLKMIGKLVVGVKLSRCFFLNAARVNNLLDVAQPALGIFQSKEIGDERAHDTDEEEEHQAYR